MAEVALGAVGVLPVLLEAIKGLKKLHSYLKTASRCVKSLQDFRVDLRIQQARFANECALMLRQFGGDEALTTSMMNDLSHDRWKDEKTIEDFLQAKFADQYDHLELVITRIRDTTRDATDHLACFDIVKNGREQDEKIQKTFERLSKRMKFPIDLPKLERRIALLRRANEDLETLCSKVDRLRSSAATDNSSPGPITSFRKPMPLYFSTVQQIANEAYAALVASFNCMNSAHDEHSVALCMDYEKLEDIAWNMAISHLQKTQDGRKLEYPIQFLLLSKQVDQHVDVENRSNSPSGGKKITVSTGLTTVAARMETTPKPSEDSGPKSNKKRKLSISESLKRGSLKGLVQRLKTSNQVKGDILSPAGPTLNLCALQNPCEYIMQNCRHSGARIAFIKKPQQSRYVFYISGKRVGCHTPVVAPKPNTSLSEYLRQESKDTISCVHQFKLALKLTQAVLHYRATPWLQEEWSLSELQLLPSADDTEDFPLYLNSKLPKLSSPPSTLAVSRTTSSNSTLTDSERMGIYNTTLFSLGKALLEIGHWKPIRELENTEFDVNYIDTVRRLSKSTVGLGGWYDDVVKKCIQCSFGSDLSQIEVQRSIYNDVVCPLEDLIQMLEGTKIS